MTKFGQVYEYDAEKRLATVHFSRPEACAKCGACGSGTQTGTVVLTDDCKVGDWVRVEMPEGRFLEATAFAYVVPLVGLLLGIGLGWLLGGGADGYTVLGAVLGLGLSAVVLRVVDKRVSGRPEWTPHITAVYDEAPDLDSIGCHAE